MISVCVTDTAVKPYWYITSDNIIRYRRISESLWGVSCDVLSVLFRKFFSSDSERYDPVGTQITGKIRRNDQVMIAERTSGRS